MGNALLDKELLVITDETDLPDERYSRKRWLNRPGLSISLPENPQYHLRCGKDEYGNPVGWLEEDIPIIKD